MSVPSVLVATIVPAISISTGNPAKQLPFTGKVQFRNETAGWDIGPEIPVFPPPGLPFGSVGYVTEPGDLVGGNNDLIAIYKDDPNYAPSTGKGSITIGGAEGLDT